MSFPSERSPCTAPVRGPARVVRALGFARAARVAIRHDRRALLRLVPLLLVTAVTACADAPTAAGNGAAPEPPAELVLLNDSTTLADRLVLGAPDAEFEGAPAGGGEQLRASVFQVVSARPVAQVAPPVWAAQALPATHILLAGNRAFVSYASPGSLHLGAVDVFDVSNASAPRLISTGIWPTAKILSVAISPDGTSLYLATATVDAGVGPAVVEAIGLNGAGQLTAARRRTTVPSFAATGVFAIGSRLFATSGNGTVGGSGGGLTVLDAGTMTRLSTDPFADARAVTGNGNQVIVVAGTPGRVRSYTTAGTFNYELPIGGLSTTDAKAGVGISANWGFVSRGSEGAALVRLRGVPVSCVRAGDPGCGTPTAVWHPFTPPVAPAGELARDAVTNAVVPIGLSGNSGSNGCNTGVVFTADGNAGIRLWESNFPTAAQTSTPTVALMGTIPASATALPGSSNMVGANADGCEGSIFIANGLGGLRVYRYRIG